VVSSEIMLGDQSRPGRSGEPRGLALAPDGTIWVAEGGYHRLQHLSLDGTSLALIAGPGDGPGQLREPTGVAVDADGSLLVTDTGHARVVRLAPDGTELASWTSAGGPTDQLVRPYAVLVAADGSILVSDPEARRVERYARDGSLVGGWATEDQCVGLALAPDGTIWSAERDAIGGAKTTFQGRLRHYSASGEVLATLTNVTWPEGVALGADGSIYLADNGHFLDNPFAVRRLSQSGEQIEQFWGQGPGRPPGGFAWVHGVVVVPGGRLLAAASQDNCLQLFAPGGNPPEAWGAPRMRPYALRADDGGGLLVVSRGDPRIHRVSPDGSTTVAASPPDYRPARQYGTERAAFGADGKLYIVSSNGSELRRYGPSVELEAISLLTPAGTPAMSVDGIAADASGRLFLSTAAAGQIRRLGTDGQVEVVWKVAGAMARPGPLAVGSSGSLYVADRTDGHVDRYSPDGQHLGMVIGPEVDGRKMQVAAMTVGPDGRLVVADEAEPRLVLVHASGGQVETIALSSLELRSEWKPGALAIDSNGRILVSLLDEGLVLRLTLG
jgi:sugar lactone lactonase YvrE